MVLHTKGNHIVDHDDDARTIRPRRSNFHSVAMSLSHSAQDCEIYSHAHSLIISHSVVLTHTHS